MTALIAHVLLLTGLSFFGAQRLKRVCVGDGSSVVAKELLLFATIAVGLVPGAVVFFVSTAPLHHITGAFGMLVGLVAIRGWIEIPVNPEVRVMGEAISSDDVF